MSSRAVDILSRISAPPSPEERAMHEQLLAAIPSMEPPMRRRVIDTLGQTVADEVFAELQAQRKAEAEARRAKAAERASPSRRKPSRPAATATRDEVC